MISHAEPGTYDVECVECRYTTTISWKSNKSRPRFCRNCGAQIAEPIHRTRYENAPRLRFKCDHPELCLYSLDCRSEKDCCISCPTSAPEGTSCPYRCKEAEVWLEWPDSDEELLWCEDLDIVIEPREVS